MKKFFGEFKSFAMRGNVIDLAIGVIIGGAFGAIITSLVNDIISPVIGIFIKTQNLGKAAVTVNGAVITYGNFIMALVNFIIIALVLFLIIRTINRMSELRKEEIAEEAPTTKVCPFCKSEIPIEATRCGHCTSQLTE